MELSKISPSSGSSSAALLPETSNNRYEQLDLNNQNAVDQKAPSCLSTVLKVLLAVPLFLINTIGKALHAVEKAGLSLINCFHRTFSSSAVEVVDTAKLADLSSKEAYGNSLLKTDGEDYKTTDMTGKTDAEGLNTSFNVDSKGTEGTITLMEGDEWEEDAQALGRIHVQYPEPISSAPANKGIYLTTIVKAVGALTVLTGLAVAGYSYMNPSEETI